MTAPDCPNPNTCPVPDPEDVDLRRLRTVLIDTPGWYSVYDRAYKDSIFNPSGTGDNRFNPIHDDNGTPVPATYCGRTRTAALLETVFHDVTPTGVPSVSRIIDLRNRGLRRIRFDTPVRVADLRDDALTHLGLTRDQLVTTSAAHHCCTRQWAIRIREVGRTPPIAGMIWRSRLTEIAAARSALLDDLVTVSATDVLVIYNDRVPADTVTGRTEYPDLAAPKSSGLVSAVINELGAILN